MFFSLVPIGHTGSEIIMEALGSLGQIVYLVCNFMHSNGDELREKQRGTVLNR